MTRRLTIPPRARLADLSPRQVRHLAQQILEDERRRQFRAHAQVQDALSEICLSMLTGPHPKHPLAPGDLGQIVEAAER